MLSGAEIKQLNIDNTTIVGVRSEGKLDFRCLNLVVPVGSCSNRLLSRLFP